MSMNFKKHFTFANFVIFVGVASLLFYTFSYLFPATDNAFVVNNVRPVAAQVKGYITEIDVKNGDVVKKGQKLFTVFDKPYIYAVEQLEAEIENAEARLSALEKTLARDKSVAKNHQDIYVKLDQDDKKFHEAYKSDAVSLMTLQNSQQDTKAAKSTSEASLKQVEIDQHNIEALQKEIKALQAKLKNVQVDLDETVVYAQSDGIVQNMFVSLGSPVNVNQPIFSFIDTDEVYIQANFNETDLRHVRNGSDVLIFPRTYLWSKMYHGKVVSDYWGANRQKTDDKSFMQNVTNENEWILLPQRLPVQIKVVDVDDNYPLRAGMSAYVYVK
ncbi:MAG: HlyD family secretion protein [Neisseriaceae bacterium]|nr:MAG: HlyD family secretion protein [Neisseriaceae bacterium]